MKNTHEDFVDLYLNWLKDSMKSTLLHTETGQYTQLSTPFLDRHNDHIQLYVKEQASGSLFLTDGGYTVNDLSMCGCDVLSSKKRNNILNSILNGFGVQIHGEEICVNATLTDFPQKKHSLIQAILAVNDMFFLSQSQVLNVFLEDVQAFFDAHFIPYVPDAHFNGASGLSHTFPFTIPATRNSPERFIRTINTAAKDKIDSAIFAWIDIRDSRRAGAMLYVIFNDAEKAVRPEWNRALLNYDVHPIPWSQRESYIDALAS